MTPAPRLQGLAAPDAAARAPVMGRDAPHRGHSGMAIDRDGAWFHEAPVARGPFRIGATGDWAAHPIRVEAGPRPYLALDAGLRARLARPVYLALAEAALAEGGDPPGLWSHGAFMSLLEPG